MSKNKDRLDEYTLFYEEISLTKHATKTKTPDEAAHSAAGISEEQMDRLSDDIRSPITHDSESDPLQ